MEKEFIPYKQALELKKVGFEYISTIFAYDQSGELYTRDGIPHDFNIRGLLSAPTFSQVFRWFREKYKIECYVNSYWNENDSSKRTYYANYNYGSDIFYTITKEFETHEEAELECLKKLIEIVKDERS